MQGVITVEASVESSPTNVRDQGPNVRESEFVRGKHIGCKARPGQACPGVWESSLGCQGVILRTRPVADVPWWR
jgi:hypothetical protein